MKKVKGADWQASALETEKANRLNLVELQDSSTKETLNKAQIQKLSLN